MSLLMNGFLCALIIEKTNYFRKFIFKTVSYLNLFLNHPNINIDR